MPNKRSSEVFLTYTHRASMNYRRYWAAYKPSDWIQRDVLIFGSRRFERDNTLRGTVRPDGVNWVQIVPSRTIPMPQTVLHAVSK